MIASARREGIRAGLEQACALVCFLCRDRIPVSMERNWGWIHGRPGYGIMRCPAWAIHTQLALVARG